MVPMRLGPRLRGPALVLAAVVASTLAGCGLFDRGSDVDEAFEYLPADTFQVQFTEGGLDDDLGTSDLRLYAEVMKDAPFNDGDVEWEAWTSWGDPGDADGTASRLEGRRQPRLDALADDLEKKGYATSSAGTM